MIRIATERDVPAILEIYRPYILQTTHTFEYEVPTREAFLLRFRTVTAQFPWLVWEENGEILGYAYADKAFARAAYQWTADLSVYLRQNVRGRGIGRKLYAAVEQIIRTQGYVLCYAIVTDRNTESCAFHLAVGYRQLAVFPDCAWKFGQRLGVIWFEKRLREEDPVSEPLCWKQLDLEALHIWNEQEV